MKKYDVDYPAYILEQERFEKNISRICDVQQRSGAKFLLALKAFSLWRSFSMLTPYIKECTASGPWEARLGHECLGGLSHTFSPAYNERDFSEVLLHSSHVIFNSIDQLNRFYQNCIDHTQDISIGLRVNPGFSPVETDLYNPCVNGSRLGISELVMPKELPSCVEGLHFHALCESNSYDLEKTIHAFEGRYHDYLPQLKWVNMGGGHLVTHKDYDVDHLVALIQRFKQKWNVEVYMEPGSAFAWETGVLVSNVVDVIDQGGVQTAILDVSFTAHMPDCLEMPYQPIVRGASIKMVEDGFVYRLGGNSCLAGDYIGDWWFDKPIEIGDQIVFEDMIHYTTVKTTFFNGVKHPDLFLEEKSGHLQLLRRFSYEDYKNRMS
ncbi:carboxynorspermidine decarboxylase [Halosquirtibacter xylanolyticus]|uniref:carboxynorspermidine decarboxylase n=1 Tax=Halosquirtibacter xylanolyticus TaxID=3374599 RepID=UPI003747A2C2|nr:carboxynorspermidine decarboxylase [Prolixibacteraceae bacterium]